MRVRLLLDCSLGRRGDEVDVGEPDAMRLLRKGRGVLVADPEEVPEPENVTEPPGADPSAEPRT